MKKSHIAISIVCGLVLAGLALTLLPSSGGCGIARIRVKVNNEYVDVETGLDSLRFFGNTPDSETLLRLVGERVADNRRKQAQERAEILEYNRTRYKTHLAIEMLIKAKHPKIEQLCEELRTDSYFSSRALDYLAEIGTPHARQSILWIESSPQCAYTSAILKLNDARSIPTLINDISKMYHSSVPELETIEKLAGEPLPTSLQRNGSYYESTDRLKMELWRWWVDYKTRYGISDDNTPR